jgi:nucleoside 2-deoxyribosyltransferase
VTSNPEECRLNIYFSCSLTGGRKDEDIYALLVQHLLEAQHEVPTAHLAHPQVMSIERIVDPDEVFQRDIAWLQDCDAVVAEVSTPSHGVGYEIAHALGLEKPVLCLYAQDVAVSKMITGNDSPGIVVSSYRDQEHALEILDDFLERVSQQNHPT